MPIYYTAEHEWIALEGEIATVGITEHAQSALGDLVYVQLPSVGQTVLKAGEAAEVESVKAASEVFAPLTGTILAVNSALANDPSLVNTDPMGRGWLFKLRVTQPGQIDELWSKSQYEASLR
jgi:glycine cleavage system H protein